MTSWPSVQVIWTVLVEALPMVGKNAQQIRAMVLRQVKAYKALLNTFCTNARTEAAFMVHLQARPGWLLAMQADTPPAC